MSSRLRTGVLGEQLAAAYLVARGMKLLARNLRLGRAEIDLVMQDGDQVVFVEVKTRRSNVYGAPEEGIGWKKLVMLRRAIAQYLVRNPHVQSVRTDSVSVRIGDSNHMHHEVDLLAGGR